MDCGHFGSRFQHAWFLFEEMEEVVEETVATRPTRPPLPRRRRPLYDHLNPLEPPITVYAEYNILIRMLQGPSYHKSCGPNPYRQNGEKGTTATLQARRMSSNLQTYRPSFRFRIYL